LRGGSCTAGTAAAGQSFEFVVFFKWNQNGASKGTTCGGTPPPGPLPRAAARAAVRLRRAAARAAPPAPGLTLEVEVVGAVLGGGG
jgi:hypothetical protein